ncbi:MAG: hypothetical protein H0V89_11480, partial [Deltaproteobacteria bacterium]|nr:hypothetical protein [Deltaproteobacteria bacterium]
MTVEKIVWTALPHGLADDGRSLRLSVHVAPRLENDTPGDTTGRTLAEFPTLGDWTAAVADFEFEVEIDGMVFGGASGVLGTRVDVPPLDPTLWQRLFPSGTQVVPFAFQDHSQKDIHVFPVRPVLRFLQEAYGAAGAAGLDLLSIDDPTGPLARFTPLAWIPTQIADATSFHQERARAELPPGQRPPGRVVREPAANPASPSAGDEEAFATAYRFYHRPGSNRTDLPGGEDHVEESPKPPDFDFHERLALLADHPGLLRRLGLVIDLVVDLGDELGNVISPGRIRVVPRGNLPAEPARNPWTAFDLDRRWFGTAPRDSFRMERGLLRLHREFFDVFQVDVDGAALKVVHLADTITRSKDPAKRNQASATEAGVPALRSGGITVARTDRGEQLLDDLGTNKALNALIESAPDTAVLHAEDVARGFRVDVYDAESPAGGRWFSLHRRLATHTITGEDGTAVVVGPDAEEGYLKGVTASSERADHPTPSDDLY